MSEISRRTFLKAGAASATAAALANYPNPAAAQTSGPSKLNDIEHFVVLMQENRSFDHYYGSLRGVRGYDDPNPLLLPDGRSVFHQPDSMNPDGYELPFRLNTLKTNAQQLHDLSHAWSVLHKSWNDGRLDGWVTSHRAVNKEAGTLTMGYYTRADLPFYYALADAFTICDGYHASVLGPTYPNRLYHWTATIDPDGKNGGPVTNNDAFDGKKNYTWETYPEALERAGISWQLYYDVDDYALNILKYFGAYRDAPPGSPLHQKALTGRPFVKFLDDLSTGNLPQVTWIFPRAAQCEHPSFLPAEGENYTRQILEALWANPKVWAKTAFILNYDENDGQFDHVVPPTAPLGTPGEYIGGLPIGLGFRVPALIISPFSRGGYVCGDTFDHTSVLRLLETRFGVEIPNLSAWRRQTCGDLTSAFGFGQVANLDVPDLPETAHALAVAIKGVETLPKPVVPLHQSMPSQEPGTRPRRGMSA